MTILGSSKEVEKKLETFAEVYGQVLVGLSRDQEEQRKRLRSFLQERDQELVSARRAVAEATRIAEAAMRHQRATRNALRLATAALAAALLALGLSVWTLLS